MPEPIPQTFEEAFKRVQELAADFKANERRYLSSDYQEAEVRKDFVDKFWMALGWDANHDFQTNPYEQEVKVERSVSSREGQTRADYAFYVKPNFRDVRFYLEAKKPSVELAGKGNYFQVACYGWNSGTPLAVIHDFQQLHILDCRGKPKLETALERAVATYHYDDYCNAEKFKEIYWLFSREAVAGGSLEKRAAELPKLRGKGARRTGLAAAKPMDEDFLETLDGHRTDLARAFKKHNPRLGSETLTELAQRTLDRLVFLRFLEDKGIEAQRLVEKFGAKGNAWEEFVAASRRLDGIYNGIVFKEHAILDKPGFRVDKEVFGGVCQHLTAATTPYNFNVIPIHILGSIYERFLGKVIVATDKRVRVEEKPEVRKAGGVYYTPEYIVRYIVENTVGRLIAGKKPEQIAGMRFADIACGSGSFLLGVFDLLLQYHGNYYNNLADADRARAVKRGDCVERDGKLYLSLQKKRKILTNNIYGVDIDHQAVEVCQLSLYLKLLKDETTVSAAEHQMEFHETLLPSLNKNIVCGNSLIGRDISEGQLFGNEVERKLNPMNFEDAFPHIFAPKDAPGMVREAEVAYEVGRTISREGGRRSYPGEPIETRGFDAIVGNPPYVRIQGFPRNQIEYLTSHYRSATGNCDLYVSFVERAYRLIRSEGRLGYIVPNKFLRTDYGEGLRELLASETALSELIDFGASQVFDATTYTCLLFLSKTRKDTFGYAVSKAKPEALAVLAFTTKPTATLGKAAWLFADEATAALLAKLSAHSERLLDLPAEMSRGSSSGDDDVFVVEATEKLEKEILRTPVFATDFNRYSFSPNKEWRIVFPYEVTGGETRLLTEQELKRRFPKAYAYLKSKHAKLRQRKQYAEWFGFSAPRNLALHDRAQIAVPLLADRGLFALIPEKTRGTLCPMASGGFTITFGSSCKFRPEYVLGLLNSKLLFWKLRQISNVFRGGWITCTKQYFGELPIASADQSSHDEMVKLVEQMLPAKAALAESQTDKDRNFYEAKCESLDRQIDALVYQLYGLMEEEIRIVEGGTV
jgi:hypothetical protein